jgi:tellurite resistance protein
MTFSEALIAACYQQAHTDCYVKEDNLGNLHTYVQIEDDEWIYEKLNQFNEYVTHKRFKI